MIMLHGCGSMGHRILATLKEAGIEKYNKNNDLLCYFAVLG
jgi:hypothetical protein